MSLDLGVLAEGLLGSASSGGSGGLLGTALAYDAQNKDRALREKSIDAAIGIEQAREQRLSKKDETDAAQASAKLAAVIEESKRLHKASMARIDAEKKLNDANASYKDQLSAKLKLETALLAQKEADVQLSKQVSPELALVKEAYEKVEKNPENEVAILSNPRYQAAVNIIANHPKFSSMLSGRKNADANPVVMADYKDGGFDLYISAGGKMQPVTQNAGKYAEGDPPITKISGKDALGYILDTVGKRASNMSWHPQTQQQNAQAQKATTEAKLDEFRTDKTYRTEKAAEQKTIEDTMSEKIGQETREKYGDAKLSQWLWLSPSTPKNEKEQQKIHIKAIDSLIEEGKISRFADQRTREDALKIQERERLFIDQKVKEFEKEKIDRDFAAGRVMSGPMGLPTLSLWKALTMAKERNTPHRKVTNLDAAKDDKSQGS